MTDQRGLPFMEAVKELAAGAGMEVPAPDPHAAKRAEQAAPLRDVMSAAQDWFVAQLQGIEGSEARDYLKRRGLSAAAATALGFGGRQRVGVGKGGGVGVVRGGSAI